MAEVNRLKDRDIHRTIIHGTGPSGNTLEIKTDEFGNVTNSAVFENVIIEAPGVNDVYKVYAGTIADAVTNGEITLTGVTSAYDIEIINKTDDTVLKVKLNDTANDDLLVNNNTNEYGKAISNLKFDKLYLTNDSGSSIDYEITITGV